MKVMKLSEEISQYLTLCGGSECPPTRGTLEYWIEGAEEMEELLLKIVRNYLDPPMGAGNIPNTTEFDTCMKEAMELLNSQGDTV